MLPSLGPLELGLILLIVVLVFGAGKLPELGSALGKTLKEFKSATRDLNEIQDTVKESVSLEPTPKKDGVAASRAAEKSAVVEKHATE